MSIIFPSNTGWITPRAKVVEITDQNCQILLSQKIAKLDKVVVNADSVYIYVDVPQTTEDYNNKTGRATIVKLSSLYFNQGSNNYVKELNITPLVKEYAAWKTLSNVYVATGTAPFGIYKNNTSYYVQNSSEITICNENYQTQGAVSFRAFPSMIQSAAYLSLPHTMHYVGSRYNEEVYINDYYVNISTSAPTTPMSTQFRVYYTPLGESVKLQTPKTIPVEREFAMPFSQQQPMVDNVSHGRGMQSISNRIGCETKQIIRVFHSIKEYRRPGVAFYEKDANGNRTGAIWRLTECNLKIYSDKMYRVVETWSKNWTLRSENVPLNREFRSWNIPADIVQRDLYYQDYCVLSKRPLAFDQTGMFFSDEAKQELFRGLTPTKNSKRTECTNMIFFRPHPTLENSKIGAVINASAFGFGNSLVFTGKTQDNLSAGVQRVAKDDSDKNYQFCKDVYYCNDDGTLPHMHIELCAALQTSEGLENDASYRYPEAVLLATGSNVYYLNIADDTNGVRLLKQYEFDIRKDPSEQLNFTYQLHLMTTEPELIIGTTWAAENGLVKERETAPTIKTWTLNKTLPGGAQAMTAYYGDLATSNDVCTVNIANGTIKFSPPANTVGVVLTDEYNNILVAYNGTTEATYTAYYTHDYSALAKAIGAAS